MSLEGFFFNVVFFQDFLICHLCMIMLYLRFVFSEQLYCSQILLFSCILFILQ